MTSEEIKRLLPGVFQRTLEEGVFREVRENNPLRAILGVMEALHEPSEAALDRLDATFDPRRASDDFIPFLARWVDLAGLFEARPDKTSARPSSQRLSGIHLGHLRELIAVAGELARWRGTARGLRQFLTTATGTDGFEILENVSGAEMYPKPFHIRVLAPGAARHHRSLIERIIVLEKPVYVTYELEFGKDTSAGKGESDG